MSIKTSVKYAWKNNIILTQEGISKLDPQHISERIEYLRSINEGVITPNDLIVDGKNPDSALSECFKNTEKQDAHNWRLQVARSILGNLTTITLDKGGNEIVSMHLISVRGDSGSRFYTDILTISESEDLTSRVVAEALAKLHAWEKRYADITELTHYIVAIKGARKNGKKRKN